MSKDTDMVIKEDAILYSVHNVDSVYFVHIRYDNPYGTYYLGILHRARLHGCFPTTYIVPLPSITRPNQLSSLAYPSPHLSIPRPR